MDELPMPKPPKTDEPSRRRAWSRTAPLSHRGPTTDDGWVSASCKKGKHFSECISLRCFCWCHKSGR